MTERPSTLRVFVVTPLGEGGRGGIDRMMDELRAGIAQRSAAGVDCRFLTSRGRGSVLLSPLFVAGVMARLLAARLTARADVVHINLSSDGSASRKMWIAGFARLLGIPTVIHLHGSRFRAYWESARPRKARRLRAMFAGAGRVIVLGRAWGDYVGSKIPSRAADIIVLPNATRRAAAPGNAARGETAILFLGRLGARKGVPQLVAALARLPRDPPWRAVLAGDGAVIETRAAIEAAGLSDRVGVPGWAGPARVRGLLEASDVLALPSLDENLPMSVIEGMAHGLAIVATPAGATGEIIRHGETGLLVPPGDDRALGGALETLIRDPELRARLGAAAKAFHREFLEIDGYVDRLVAIWREAAGAQLRPRGGAWGEGGAASPRTARVPASESPSA
jgi:glycosyltransferase involved in cell wall biosynthesis